MFIPTTGASGAIHRSKSEAKLSDMLLPVGIVPRDDYYPQPFTDAEGASFRAMSDGRCQYTGIYFEYKHGHMNGLKTNANADKAMSRFEEANAKGFIKPYNYNIKKLEASWSASVPKFKAVQDQIADAGGCVVLIYDALPDAKTVGRLERSKVFWCVYGDEHFRKFMSLRTMARYGFPVAYTIKDHLFTANGWQVA